MPQPMCQKRIDEAEAHPEDILDALRAVPEPSDTITNGPNSQHPAKRRKVEYSLVPSHCVSKGQLVFRRPCRSKSATTYVEKRINVGEYMHFKHIDYNSRHMSLSDGDTVKIFPLRTLTSYDGPRTIYVPLVAGDACKRVADTARIAGRTFLKKGLSPGSIWSEFDVCLECKDNVATLTIDCRLYWNETPSPLNGLRQDHSDHRTISEDLINSCFPPDSLTGAGSPRDFYDAAFVPSKDDEEALSIETPGLGATLYPYQKRTLQWMLRREGVQWSADQGVQDLRQEIATPVSDSSRRVQDVDGNELFVSDTLHTISASNEAYRIHERKVRGGVLAEEMGLGKTLELLGLILTHTRPLHDTPSSTTIQSGATLIVSPEPLRSQWLSEISRHAPGLRLEYYKGCAKEKGDIAKRLAECDVVVTTYSVLASEIHFAFEAPERSRRQQRKYERRTSPLVLVNWWRLCLDEAQMIENGFSQAAITARTIPRVNAWGVTGTPVKDDVKDLFGLLTFLRYEPLCSAPQTWKGMLKSHKWIFQRLFNTISVRHTKTLVRDEIALPPQRRYTISVPFTAVEEQHYQTLFKEMTADCGVDLQGNPTSEDWIPDDYEEEMRLWLNRLRQTALHPEVGTYGRRILGQNKRPMRTVEEVLDAMLENSESTIKADQRALLANRLTRGQLLENSPRVEEARDIWEGVKKEAEQMVAEARRELQLAIEEGRTQTRKAFTADGASGLDDSEDDENDARGGIGEARRKIRSALDMQHKAVFFCANAYFQIRGNENLTEPDSEGAKKLKDMEDKSYEEAKIIRREILRESHTKASRLMEKISRKAKGQSFAEVAELEVNSAKGTIDSTRAILNLEALYGALNEQANVVDEWREHSAQLLIKPLVDEEDDMENTGEEMGDAVQMQDEMVIYVQVLRAAIADRQDSITGQKNELVDYETKASIRMAIEGDGPMPEKLLELFEARNQLKPQGVGATSMRGAISELRGLVTRLRNESPQTQRVRIELEMTSKLLKETQTALTEQTKAAAALEAEVESFRTTMNARLEYYRQLQNVSDGVLPHDGPKTEDAVDRMVKTEEALARKVASAEAKHRYLLNLKEAGSKSNEPRMCVICQTPFETGVLTVCGHQFCKECMMHWYKAHRNCPVCKKHLKSVQLHDITMKPQELRLHGESSSESNKNGAAGNSPQGKSRPTNNKTVIYSTFGSDKLAAIQNIELDGPSYTTKVDTLVRHLLWIRQTDPGAKSIVFSQYKDFLGILATAFRRFRIGFASIDAPNGTTQFKEDPAVEVFLLHARAHSSGLNLVNANNVFLCEPLVNTALELQAIARVDRIGQEHETTVWLYVTQGTVEESIYNLSVQRRLEHMDGNVKVPNAKGENGKGKNINGTSELLDANLEAANTREMEQAALTKLMSKDKTAGEIVAKGDLWECLFGHVTTT